MCFVMIYLKIQKSVIKEKEMNLTPRLQKVFDLAPKSNRIADIGTDHAYLPICFIESGKAAYVIAGDIHEGPAKQAEKHIFEKSLSERIDVRVGPGLSVICGENIDGVTITGMGGLMIVKILESDKEIANKINWFVLQPQNHIKELRLWLSENGYRIEKEALAEEGTMLYEMMLVRHGSMVIENELQAEIGCTESLRKDPLFPLHINRLLQKRKYIIEGIDENTEIERHKLKREKALQEKGELEKYETC